MEIGLDMNCETIMSGEAVEALGIASAFLKEHTTSELLELVGQTVEPLALQGEKGTKASFPKSYGGGKSCDDDVLTGLGAFYITQSGKLMLDCIGGHYQMTWGYNHPELMDVAREGMDLGVVWDTHANTPSLPVKLLAEQLISFCGESGLDRAFLGVCTGSVACEAALKIMLLKYAADEGRAKLGIPIILTMLGNYHGTGIPAQTMRGMWTDMSKGMETVQIAPNDKEGLRTVFAKYGRRIAGFWAEPVMMNREAILVDRDYLLLAQELCRENDALLTIDEIQTGFWYPEVFLFNKLGLKPDMVIVGKGMTAGFHPLAGVLYRAGLDIFEQYDAISTNGNASLASLVSLGNLDMLKRERDQLQKVIDIHTDCMRSFASDFPKIIEKINGDGLLTGIRFQDREVAIKFHAAALERGLWLRVHAYYEGHRTVLLKHPLVVDEEIVRYVDGVLREVGKDLKLECEKPGPLVTA